MKERFTLLVFALLLQWQFNVIQAQISITADDLPHAGLEVSTTVTPLPIISVGQASDKAQIWNYTSLDVASTQRVVFSPIEEDDLIASENFPNASMKNNLLSVFGGGSDLFPIDIGGANSYYTQDNEGNIRISGVNLDLGIDIDSLGIDVVNLIGDPADPFYAVGEYGDSFNSEGSYEYTFTIEVDTLPLPVPVTIRIQTDRQTDIDAFGTMQFSGEDYDVLRYNELTDVNLFVGVLFFDVPIFSFIDTSFQVPAYRFYTKDKGYPLANVSIGEDDSGAFASSVEYLAALAPDPVGFSYEVNCLNTVFTNTSNEGESVGGPLLSSFWDLGDGTTSNLKDVVHNYEEEGTYEVFLEVVHQNGSVNSLSKTVEVSCVDVGIEDLPHVMHRVFPNPVNDILHFDFEADALSHIDKIVVFNPLGQQIHTISSLNDSIVNLDVSDWNGGVYFYALISKEKGTVFGDRFIVQH
ncbi:MAG: PKD domain-containing protein [Chitinophagales bacterium]